MGWWGQGMTASLPSGHREVSEVTRVYLHAEEGFAMSVITHGSFPIASVCSSPSHTEIDPFPKALVKTCRTSPFSSQGVPSFLSFLHSYPEVNTSNVSGCSSVCLCTWNLHYGNYLAWGFFSLLESLVFLLIACLYLAVFLCH